MEHDDDIDPRLAGRFAWQWAKPGAAVPDVSEITAEEPASETDEPNAETDEASAETDDAALEARRREAHAAAEKLAAAVERVAALADRAAQRRGIERLLAEIDRLGLAAAALINFPREHLHLVRLVVRQWSELSQHARDHSMMALFFLDHDHPGFADLLVESARTGDETIFTRLYMGCHERADLLPHAARISEPLARIVDEGPTDEARSIAVRWLGIAATAAAAPGLRSALYRKNPVLRWRALEALLDLPDGALRAEDVAHLAEQAADDPPARPGKRWDEDLSRALYCYPMVLAKAIARLRPAGARAPLLEIANGHASGYRDCLDQDWALETLADAFPDDAIPIIDRFALDHATRHRRFAVRAAARLPEPEAVTRLGAAALDPSPAVAHAARDEWLARFASPLPASDLDALPPALRPLAPSDAFHSRLQILRGTSEDAGHAMADALFGQPPDAEERLENLALLLLAAGDDRQWHRQRRPGMPEDRKGWTQAILDRYGAAAAAGLAWLAQTQPVGRYGWWDLLSKLVSEQRIEPVAIPVLRAAAADWFTSPRWDGSYEVLPLLAATGAPPELKERLFALVCDDPQKDSNRWLLSHHAARVLIAWPADAALDARILSVVASAHAAAQWPRLSFPLEVAVARRLPEATALALRLLADPDPAIPHSLRHACAANLEKIHQLPRLFVTRSLAAPEHPAFAVACRMTGARPTARQRQLLSAALDSRARDGASALDALDALLFDRNFAPSDRRVPDILARAPLHMIPGALFALLYRRVPIGRLAAALRAVFTSPDETIATEAAEQLPRQLLGARGGKKLFAELRPLVRSPELAEAMEEALASHILLAPRRRKRRAKAKRR